MPLFDVLLPPAAEFGMMIPGRIVFTDTSASTVTIEAGGKMTIDGCTLEQADITVKPGGELTLINNGHIILKKGDDMNAEKGSIVNINNGCSIDIGN